MHFPVLRYLHKGCNWHDQLHWNRDFRLLDLRPITLAPHSISRIPTILLIMRHVELEQFIDDGDAFLFYDLVIFTQG